MKYTVNIRGNIEILMIKRVPTIKSEKMQRDTILII